MLSLTGGVLGLIIGAVLGLTGAGGGIFAVPALVFGLPPPLDFLGHALAGS